MTRCRRLFFSLILIQSLALALSASVSWAADCTVEPGAPRVLVLALDGIPLRLMEQARAQGKYAGWQSPRPLISTFPSVTNVSFTAMFSPFGVEPARGYEVQFYDWDRDMVVGGTPWGYSDDLFAWREVFDLTGKTVGGKLSIYTSPQGSALKEIDEAARLLFETDKPFVLAHVGATDAMLHLRGDPAVLEFVLALDGHLEQIRERYRAERGGELAIALLSDHGNSQTKVKSAKGVRKKLKKAGLHPAPRLTEPDDVVAATFGLLNYGVLFTAHRNAETAARAMVRHDSVEIAAWLEPSGSVGVVSRRGSGRIVIRDGRDGRKFAYTTDQGDPLELLPVVEALQLSGSLDADGFASESAWLTTSVDSRYPDAPRRLVDGLDGAWVENTASVIFSIKQGFAWGWKSAFASSFMWGGYLEGTHGGLDRDSSIGFFMADDPGRSTPAVLSVSDVLVPYAGIEACRHEEARHVAGSPPASTPPEANGHAPGPRGN